MTHDLPDRVITPTELAIGVGQTEGGHYMLALIVDRTFAVMLPEAALESLLETIPIAHAELVELRRAGLQ